MTTAKPITSADVAAITGFKLRWVQIHAAKGDIPSATQLVDNGDWRFDEKTVRNWMNARRRVKCQTPTSISGKASGMPAFKSEDATIDEAYERALNP